ncbi:reverse transcriptase [Phytophthora megakarya]|uniref:Reverse transcriptase n=1 Tax=Phytophthora megakarya TaxID=4795 RepID=A0A225WME4_9STRA|nr:reverse transcriptase [Phytophthora megakarya]
MGPLILLEGGYIWTYESLCKEFNWIGMYKDTERYVKGCVDYAMAKGLPRNLGSSPGNLFATLTFPVSMDFVIPLPQPTRENTALLVFQCAFSGFMMCKAMASTETQDVAEAYEECFGASEMIRHDRDPRFMGRVFKHFREMLGSRQRLSPPGQRTTRYVSVDSDSKRKGTVDQSDWDQMA